MLKKYLQAWCDETKINIDINEEDDARYWVNSLAILKGNRLKKRVAFSIALLNQSYLDNLSLMFSDLSKTETFDDRMVQILMVIPDLQYVPQSLKEHAVRRFFKLMATKEYFSFLEILLKDKTILSNMMFSIFSSCKNEFVRHIFETLLPNLNGKDYEKAKRIAINILKENIECFSDYIIDELKPNLDNLGSFNIIGAEYILSDHKELVDRMIGGKNGKRK